MSEKLHFEGRILFLSTSANAVRRQLNGENLTLDDTLPLRDRRLHGRDHAHDGHDDL